MLIVWLVLAYLAGVSTFALLLGVAAMYSAGIDSSRSRFEHP